MLKILSYKVENGLIDIETNNKEREHFVYFVDQFKTLESLQAEIQKSILFEERRKIKNTSHIDSILTSLDLEVAKNSGN